MIDTNEVCFRIYYYYTAWTSDHYRIAFLDPPIFRRQIVPWGPKLVMPKSHHVLCRAASTGGRSGKRRPPTVMTPCRSVTKNHEVTLEPLVTASWEKNIWWTAKDSGFRIVSFPVRNVVAKVFLKLGKRRQQSHFFRKKKQRRLALRSFSLRPVLQQHAHIMHVAQWDWHTLGRTGPTWCCYSRAKKWAICSTHTHLFQIPFAVVAIVNHGHTPLALHLKTSWRWLYILHAIISCNQCDNLIKWPSIWYDDRCLVMANKKWKL